MRLLRSIFLVGSAAALSGGLAVSAVTAGANAAPAVRANPVRAHLTASFRSEARAALVRDLNRNHGTAWFVHGRPGNTARVANTTDDQHLQLGGLRRRVQHSRPLHQGQRGLDGAFGDLYGGGPDHL